jgi:lipid II:glycine glycyltransferase (peptidoglycan interpeptide bridge formation enzyme)
VRRQEYRRGLELGLTVEPSTDIELLNRLHAATFMRQGITRDPAEEQLFVKIATAAVRQGYGELLVCRLDSGAPASATLFLHDDRYAYYYVGANDPEYRKSGAGTFLLAENIRRALARGALAVDFVGINSPSRGDFKTSFNACPVPYYTVDYTRGAV